MSELVSEQQMDENAKNWIHGDCATTCGGVPVGAPVDLDQVRSRAQEDPEALAIQIFKIGFRAALESIRTVEVDFSECAPGCCGWDNDGGHCSLPPCQSISEGGPILVIGKGEPEQCSLR